MDRDIKIWKALSIDVRFFRYKEIKKLFPHLNDAQLSKSLRRLEKCGLLVRDVSFDRDKPINVYLAIDPLKTRVRIVDLRHWLYAIVEWTDTDGLSRRLVGIDLGELADYIRDVDGELYLEWPKWVMSLALAQKVSFDEHTCHNI